MQLVRRLLRLALALAIAVGAGGEVRGGLIVNGDFEAGNTGFVSDFVYRPDASRIIPGHLGDAGQYVITDDLYKIHNLTAHMFDHTTGSGNMLVVNGTENAPKRIWSSTVSVTENTSYRFSMWFSGWRIESGVISDPPGKFRFEVNGTQIGSEIAAPPNSVSEMPWLSQVFLFNSGSSTQLELAIVNTTSDGGGNDFVFDDFSLTESTVPEPTTLAIFGALGMAGIATRRRRKQTS